VKNQNLLTDLKIGEKALIEGFTVADEMSQRLLEMGLTPGEAVEVIRFAPMGDPLEIRIKGYLLSLRRDEAVLIKINRD
jgi:ferrous iron transport protein A